MKLTLRPMSLRAARRFVARHHRHHEPPQGGKFAIQALVEDVCVGVAIVGRPVARALDDGWTAEVIRVATDGTPNACSFLYSAAKRAAQAMGYRKVITYTLIEESGASLRAGIAPALPGAVRGIGSTRPRLDSAPTQEKIRWDAP